VALSPDIFGMRFAQDAMSILWLIAIIVLSAVSGWIGM
jgi:hypothetical protein